MMQARHDEGKQEEAMPEEGIGSSGILALNGLTYKLPPDLSVAIQRNNQSMYFQSPTFAPGQTAVCVLNTGASYVDFRRSFLVITASNISTTSPPAAHTCFFGPNGSACNLINRITILTRSGAQIERIDNVNQLNSARLYMEHSSSWVGQQYIDATGTITGAGAVASDGAIEAGLGPAAMYGAQGVGFLPASTADDAWKSNSAATNQIRFCIPLGELSTVWKHSQSLWPAALCSGLRVELLFENAANAMMVQSSADTGVTLNYSIDEIYLQLECYQLSDNVLRSLNEMASTSALEVVSVTAHNTQGSRGSGNNSLSLDCGRACSRALAFLYRERPAVAIGAGFDPFATVTMSASNYISNFQARVGSLYFPQQGVKAFNSNWRTAVNELYANSLQCLGRFGIDDCNCATNLFKFRTQRLNIYQTLERSGVIAEAGLPLSNSRLLNVQSTWVGSTGTPTLVDFYLFFSVLIRVYLNGASIEV
jgi:hypothetical protein